MSDEQARRDRVVAIAKSWMGTPYHDHARLKGIGVDCGQIIVAVFDEADLAHDIDVKFYSPQWMLHRREELYLSYLATYMAEIEGPPQPGDIAIWKFGHTFSHSGIVTEWPVMIHARAGQPVVMEDADAAQWLKFIGESRADEGKLRPVKFFSYWAKVRGEGPAVPTSAD